MKVAIIGGGLAGTACAYMLKQAGAAPVIYEAGAALAGGASGNPVGLYNPRFTAERNAESEYFSAAFMLALQTFSSLSHPEEFTTRDLMEKGRSLRPADVRDDSQGIDWNPCGALHLMNDEKKRKRFPQTVESWGWPEEEMRIVTAREASEIAGVEIGHDALYLPHSGTVSPQKLCHAYARDVEIHLNAKIENLEEVRADAVILACSAGVRKFSLLPVRMVRGQVTQARATARSEKLTSCVCYGGYVSPAHSGMHTVGATFQRWLSHDNILEEDDADNLAKLNAALPGFADGMQVAGQRAAVRTTTADYMPIVGQMAERVYISAAHGSHGILSSLIAARMLAAIIAGRAVSMDSAVLDRVSPRRFLS